MLLNEFYKQLSYLWPHFCASETLATTWTLYYFTAKSINSPFHQTSCKHPVNKKFTNLDLKSYDKTTKRQTNAHSQPNGSYLFLQRTEPFPNNPYQFGRSLTLGFQVEISLNVIKRRITPAGMTKQGITSVSSVVVD